MRYSVSDTAEWGDYVSGPKVVTDDTRKAMKEILANIQSGAFAEEWMEENADGRPVFNSPRGRDDQPGRRGRPRTCAHDAVAEPEGGQAGRRRSVGRSPLIGRMKRMDTN
jgi:hypothetical protein